jgi:hypothetical protein
MNEEDQAKAYQDGLQKEINAYGKLKDIGQSKELSDFLDLLMDTAAQKMSWAFIGDNVKSWEDFLKVRGEIVSYLFPIQEIRGADAMEKQLKSQLDQFYKKS